MAMYVMEEMPDIHGTGEQVLYPRFAMMDQVSTEELIRQIASSSGFNVGDVEGVITQIGIEMAHQMAEGKSVKLDGIEHSLLRWRYAKIKSVKRPEKAKPIVTHEALWWET